MDGGVKRLKTPFRPRARTRLAAASHVILIVAITVMVIAGIAWLVVRSGDPADALTGDAATTHFVCENCGEYFGLESQQIFELERTGRLGRGPGQSRAVPCPKCGQQRGVMAEKCPQHGDIVKREPRTGEAVKCSKCDFSGAMVPGGP